MRIELRDPRRSHALKDYFLRLGAVAVVNDDLTVAVDFPEDALTEGASIEDYLASWVKANHVDVRPARAEAAPEPEPAVAITQIRPLGFGSDAAPPRLGDLLVSKGFITQDQLSQALVESRQAGDLLGRVLLRHGWVFEPELARTLAEQWGIPYVNLAMIGVDRYVMRLLPREIGLQFAAIPVRYVDEGVRVAFADPSDAGALAAVQKHLPSIAPAVAELSDIEMAWRAA
jgi:hypothetical protein